jgi:hypothetical protein
MRATPRQWLEPMIAAALALRRHPFPRGSGPGRQRGVGFGGLMIGLVLVVFFANLAIVLFPAYTTFWQVRSIMDGLAEREDVLAEGPRGIMNSVGTQLTVNGVSGIKTGDFNLERIQGGYELLLDYEVRKHLFFNIDVVMDFAHEVTLQTP